MGWIRQTPYLALYVTALMGALEPVVSNAGSQPMHTVLVPLEGCHGFPLDGRDRTTGRIVGGCEEPRQLGLVSVPWGRSQNLV